MSGRDLESKRLRLFPFLVPNSVRVSQNILFSVRNSQNALFSKPRKYCLLFVKRRANLAKKGTGKRRNPPMAKALEEYTPEKDPWASLRSRPGITIQSTARREP